MAFWNRESDEQTQARLGAEQEQAASLAALNAGRLPLKAEKRLKELAASGGFFTSDLSANEHILTRQAGYEPLAQVMGSAFYKVAYRGYYAGGYQSTGELTALSQAQLSARTVAVSRLRQEATLLGADGVIGVRLQVGAYDWSTHLVEFTAVGTAIRWLGSKPFGEKSSTGGPFTSALDGQAFWKLSQAGYLPREVAFGVCSYYIHGDQQTRSLLGGMWGQFQGNQEVVQFNEGFRYARQLATDRFRHEVSRASATGAVGVKVSWDLEDIEYEQNDRTYHDLLVNFTALGTAIVPSTTAKQTSTLTFMNLKE